LGDHLRETTELADFAISKHLCVQEGERLASVDTQTNCIKYNKEKLEYVARRWGIDAAKGVWLHEMAHIKQVREGKLRNVYTHANLKVLELEADEYAGCQMKRQQLDVDDFIDYMEDSYIPDSKHGTLKQRIAAIQAGHDRC
jgi:hypothetical protein